MAILFISDLHLEESRPDIGKQFVAFLEGEARRADALYILGDLFEAWLGDDDPNPYYAQMKTAIRKYTERGIPTYFMHGNRDFMIGDAFASETGLSILADPYTLQLHDDTVVLSHGDALCTDDLEYQAVRQMTRDPAWQSMMLEKSIEERIAFAAHARQQSMQRGEQLTDNIADVNGDAVTQLLVSSGADVLLHGHTHRPAVHPLDIDGRSTTRVVLGDWYEQGSVVRWDETGPELCAMPR